MNNSILLPEVQQFIAEHLKENSTAIALAKTPFKDVSSTELAEQLESKQRCEKKLPTWFNTPGIYYPPKLAIEQSSSEITARYKSKLLNGKTVADLTGGFGADTFYFSKTAKQVAHCELNPELSAIVKYNAQILNIKNIDFFEGDGLGFVQASEQKFGTVFIDPSRRIKSQKVFFLKNCEPDVVSNLGMLLTRTDRILIKTSPLLDITSGLKELAHVSEVHVVSVKNDCKELLWVIENRFEGEPEIICAALGNGEEQVFAFNRQKEKQTPIDLYSEPLKYLYEPDASLLKAGCFKLIVPEFKVFKLDRNTHLYTSEALNGNFIGRIFIIDEVMDYKAFGKKPPLKKANILSRNFPLSPAELKKKHKLTDGGNEYLIFTRANEKLITIRARRV